MYTKTGGVKGNSSILWRKINKNEGNKSNICLGRVQQSLNENI